MSTRSQGLPLPDAIQVMLLASTELDISIYQSLQLPAIPKPLTQAATWTDHVTILLESQQQIISNLSLKQGLPLYQAMIRDNHAAAIS